MSDATDRQIAALIVDMAGLMTGFVAILEEEQQVLTAGVLDRLLPLAERKTEFAGRLATLDDQRLRSLQSGQQRGKADIATWLARMGDAGLRQTWQSVLELAAKAHQLNASNGQLIGERMRHNQQALAVLMAAGERSALYGPDGQPRLGGGGRPLGSA